ncbi:MAG: hypothetical protein ACOWWO_11950 [Peptococcaceae bacterium]
MHVGIGGQYKEVENIWVGVDGVWKEKDAVFCGIDGEWKPSDYIALVSGRLSGDESYYVVNADNIELYAKRSATGTQAGTSVVTDVPVSLTGVSTISVEWDFECEGTNNTNAHFIASTNKTGSNSVFDARYWTERAFTKKIQVLDVSNLDGDFYLRCHAQVTSTASISQFSKVRVYRLWLDDNLIWEG